MAALTPEHIVPAQSSVGVEQAFVLHVASPAKRQKTYTSTNAPTYIGLHRPMSTSKKVGKKINTYYYYYYKVHPQRSNLAAVGARVFPLVTPAPLAIQPLYAARTTQGEAVCTSFQCSPVPQAFIVAVPSVIAQVVHRPVTAAAGFIADAVAVVAGSEVMVIAVLFIIPHQQTASRAAVDVLVTTVLA